MKKLIALCILSALFGVITGSLTVSDPNNKPTYGKTGLPRNCRAIVQSNIDGFRAGRYTANEAMGSIERNCGSQGYSWGP